MERLPFSNVSGIQQFSVFQYPSTNIINEKNRRIKENNVLYKNLLDFSRLYGSFHSVANLPHVFQGTSGIDTKEAMK